MNWIALYKTIGLCLFSILIEAVSASKEGKRWFETLRQPKYSFPFAVWYVVGGVYYLLCGIIAYRLFNSTTALFNAPIILLALIMIFNGLTNFILFKFRSVRIFYWTLFPYTILFIGLIGALPQDDGLSIGLAAMYLLWLFYDIYYFKVLWQINKSTD